MLSLNQNIKSKTTFLPKHNFINKRATLKHIEKGKASFL